MKQKILLINPNFENPFVYKKNDMRDSPGIPRGILSLGTYLKKNDYDVKILDMRLSENTLETIKTEAKDALWIGLSVMTTQIRDALKISDELKKTIKAPIVWGGIHSTLFPKITCQDPSVDLVIFEEGEGTALEISNLLANGQTNFNDVKGLVYKKNGEVIKNISRPHINLNYLPNLDFSLIDIERYIYKTVRGEKDKKRLLPIESSRGCPHRCGFCFHVLCNDRKYRVKDVDKVIADIQDLINRYGIEAISFAEDNFFVQRGRVVDICNKLIENNIQVHWRAECRADYFRPGFVDDELLSLATKAGLRTLTIGAESGSLRVLNYMTKDITPEQIINAAKQCNKYNIYASFSFIAGLPEENKEDVKKTTKMIKQVKKICPISSTGFGLFRPYPGGHLYNTCFRLAKIEEPKTLRDWTNKKYMGLMSLDTEIPWNKNANHIKNASFYGRMFFFFNKDYLGRFIKKNPVRGVAFSLFVFVCALRFYLNFFNVPIEKKFFEYVIKKMKITLPC